MRVIVFTARGCPAGWLGAYGNEWVATPNLDRLAAEGVVFDRHIADCPDPDAARTAWLTGRYQLPELTELNLPTPFPGKEGGADQSPSPGGRGAGGEVLHSVFVRANHPDTDAPAPFYAHWGEVFDARPQADDDSPLDELLRSLPALLDRLADRPDWLLWIDTDRLVPPWDVPQEVFEAYLDESDENEPDDDTDDEEPIDDGDDEEEEVEEDEEEDVEYVGEPDESDPDSELSDEPVTPWADPPTGPFDRTDPDAWDWLHKSFAAVVTKLDAELGRLFEQFRARGLDASAAWVVTADHGHPLGEHGQIGVHRPWLHEELVHLPLVVRLPGAAEAGRRVAAFTQPADLAPTLLGLFGTPASADVHGHDLQPLMHGKAEAVRPYAVSGLATNGGVEFAIRTPDAAFLLPVQVPEGDPPRGPMLFVKPDDRWEVNDLQGQSVEQAEQLEAVLRRFVNATHQPGPLVVPDLAPSPEASGE